MNLEELLYDKPCDCGMTHRCSIKHVLIESGAIQKIGALLDGYQKVLLVADTNTYATCGKAVEAQIGSRLENVLIYKRDGLLIPNEEAIEEMRAMLTQQTDLIVGIGEEVIVTRPNIFGPLPSDVARIVHKSVRTRLMAHTAEDLCEWHMPEKEVMRALHGDIKNGFLMIFHDSPPDVDLDELEAQVKADIAAKLDVEYVDDRTIRIGEYLQPCTGPRTHVSNTGSIENFHLLKEIIYDHRNQRWLLVGRVGKAEEDGLHHYNDLMLG